MKVKVNVVVQVELEPKDPAVSFDAVVDTLRKRAKAEVNDALLRARQATSPPMAVFEANGGDVVLGELQTNWLRTP